MKIGIVCPYNIFIGGGVQEVALALRDGAEKRGHEAYIITPQPKEIPQRIPKNVLIVGGSRPVRTFATVSQFSASVDTDRLDEMLDEHNFDIIHFHEPWVPILSRQIMIRSNAIHIGTFHAAMSERASVRTIERVITPYTKSILKYLDVMTAVSPAATNYVKTISKRQLLIVPNGIDLSKYKVGNGPHDANRVTILYVGRLEKRKAVKYLIAAFSEVKQRHPNYRLLIAGNGPDREKLEELVNELKVKDVEFLGFISEEEKLRLLQRSDLFCSPAMYGESFGIVLLEAMASGCVTVAGNNSGYEGVLTGTGQISLIDPKDTKEFARRLVLLATDEKIRAAWLDWAKENVKKYEYSKVIDQYLAIYKAAYAKKNSKT